MALLASSLCLRLDRAAGSRVSALGRAGSVELGLNTECCRHFHNSHASASRTGPRPLTVQVSYRQTSSHASRSSSRKARGSRRGLSSSLGRWPSMTRRSSSVGRNPTLIDSSSTIVVDTPQAVSDRSDSTVGENGWRAGRVLVAGSPRSGWRPSRPRRGKNLSHDAIPGT